MREENRIAIALAQKEANETGKPQLIIKTCNNYDIVELNEENEREYKDKIVGRARPSD